MALPNTLKTCFHPKIVKTGIVFIQSPAVGVLENNHEKNTMITIVTVYSVLLYIKIKKMCIALFYSCQWFMKHLFK